jgi:hypothetical protein
MVFLAWILGRMALLLVSHGIIFKGADTISIQKPTVFFVTVLQLISAEIKMRQKVHTETCTVNRCGEELKFVLEIDGPDIV